MKKKFTLIELIAVISILGILATMIIPNISSFQGEATETAIKVDAKNLQTSVDMYGLDHYGNYPSEVQPEIGNPQPIKFDLLYPKYLREIPNHDGVYYWVDYQGKVWLSPFDSPVSVVNDGTKVSWTEVNGADYYNVFQIVDSTIGAVNHAQKLKFLEKVTANQYSKDVAGKIFVVSAVSSKGFETAPVGYGYTGYKGSINLEGENKTTSPISQESLIYQSFTVKETLLSQSLTFPKTTSVDSPSSITPTYSMDGLSNFTAEFNGSWSGQGTNQPYTKEAGAWTKIQFYGTGIDINFQSSLSGTSNNVEVWIDGKQYPSIDTRTWSGTNPLVKNLPQGNHELILKNNNSDKWLQITVFRTYNDYTNVLNPSISTALTNGVIELKYPVSFTGMQKYVIYRSKTPNIDVDNYSAYDIIEKEKSLNYKKFKKTSGFSYYDTLYNNDTYYYKIVGIDGSGYRWISNEISTSIPNPLPFSHNSLREGNEWITKGTWSKGSNEISSNKSGSIIEIPFVGTGVDLQINTNVTNSANVEVWIDNIQYPSINTTLNGLQQIARNLPYGQHTLKLVNLEDRYLTIYKMSVYMNDTQVNNVAFSALLENGSINLTLNSNFSGLSKYYIFRSLNPNIDISKSHPIYEISGDKTIDNYKVYFNGSTIKYFDTIYDSQTYYYLVLGLDGDGEKHMSNEVSITIPTSIQYKPINNREDTWIYSGVWTKTSTYVYTSKANAAIEIPFTGTSIDLYLQTGSSNSKNVEVWVDGIQYSSLDTSISPSVRNISSNLPYGKHTLKLINKVEGYFLQINSIKVNLQ